MIKDIQESPTPFDRLTKLAGIMQEVAETPEYADVRGIIFLADPDRGGIVMFGYDDTTSGMADLLVHMKAVFQSQGKSFGVMTDQGVMMVPED
jgi:hypothetical protein